jgi:hypothetical protein
MTSLNPSERAGLLSSDENFKKLKSNSKTKFKFKAKRTNFGQNCGFEFEL